MESLKMHTKGFVNYICVWAGLYSYCMRYRKLDSTGTMFVGHNTQRGYYSFLESSRL